MLPVNPVPSAQLLRLNCGAAAGTGLTVQLPAALLGNVGLAAPSMGDTNPWLEGTLEKAAQGACEGLCL